MAELTLKELMDDLLYLHNLNKDGNGLDGRLLTIFLYLYIEHFINKLSKEKRIKERLLIKKSQKLLELKIIEKDQYEIIDLINDIRNELVHNLRPDNKQIERWIIDLKLIDPLIEQHHKDLFNRSNGWVKIQIYAVKLIVDLYKLLMKIRNEEITHNIEIRTTEINGHLYWAFEEQKKIN